MASATELSEKAALFPDTPGVYLMKDARGGVLYVGKAKSLKKRVRSYFRKTRGTSAKTALMVSKVSEVETLVTPTEKDALILENSLIKKHRPRYNVVFRDDKEYPYLRISAETYPALSIVRRPQRDAALYFGPFASAHAVKETLKFLRKNFLVRKCKDTVLKKHRPCVYFQLGQCLAPCCRPVSEQVYQKAVKDIRLFLSGRSDQVVKALKQEMQRCAEQLEFESAAKLRDRLAAIEKTLEKQSVVSSDLMDRDVFAFTARNMQLAVTALFLRGGRLIGSRNFHFKNIPFSETEPFGSFLSQYYDDGAFIPPEIVVSASFPDMALLRQWLCDKKGERVEITAASRGFKRDVLNIAQQNCDIFLNRVTGSDTDNRQEALSNLEQRLSLSNYPSRIECFDISTIAGSAPCGAMSVFKDGLPAKPCYRRFGITSLSGQDDYAMMRQVLTRRLGRAGTPGWETPDLILVDGGKGQLGILTAVIRETGFSGIDTAAIAKPKAGEVTEKIFLPFRKNPLILSKNSPELLLLKRIRDEAHRFAVTYHATIRKKKDLSSALEKVPGIGRKKALCLLNRFGSVEAVRGAALEALRQTPCLTDSQAEAVYNHFRNQI